VLPSFHGSDLEGAQRLCAAFTASLVFEEHYGDFLQSLERSSARLPEATCNACERFIDIAGPDAGDMRTRAAAEAYVASPLIIRIYSQASDAHVKARCLDVIDKLTAMKAHGISDALSQYER
jgi:hypothetical protein